MIDLDKYGEFLLVILTLVALTIFDTLVMSLDVGIIIALKTLVLNIIAVLTLALFGYLFLNYILRRISIISVWRIIILAVITMACTFTNIFILVKYITPWAYDQAQGTISNGGLEFSQFVLIGGIIFIMIGAIAMQKTKDELMESLNASELVEELTGEIGV